MQTQAMDGPAGGTVTLEKIDQVRERTGAGYGECYEALRVAEGDVVRALIAIEQSHPGLSRRLQDNGSAAAERVRDLYREAVRTRIALRQGERTLLQMPAVVGVAGSLALPGLAAAGVIAALATHTSITVERASTGL
jgi:hypothetical protein